MFELIKKVAKYSKHERIMRVIEIAVKGDNATPYEECELMIIQFIRQHNGEIDEIIESRKTNPL